MNVISEPTIIRVTLDDILQNLRGYLQRVESGESFVILKSGAPVAEIKPIEHPVKPRRPYGLCKGEFVVPDDFDAPLPIEFLKEFES